MQTKKQTKPQNQPKNKMIDKLVNATSNIAQLDKQLAHGGKFGDIAKTNTQPIVTEKYIRAHIRFREKQGYLFRIDRDDVKLVDFKKS